MRSSGRRTYGSLGFSRRLRNLERCVEHKFQDFAGNWTLTNTLAVANNMTQIAQGDTDSQREGSRLAVTKFKVNFNVTNNSTETSSILVRIIIAAFANTNGATPGVLAAANNILSPYYHNQSGMKIWFDQTFAIGIGTSGAGGPTQVPIHFNKSFGLKPHCVKYSDSDTTGVMANTMDGLVQLYAYQTTPAVAFASLGIWARTYFVDM